VSSPTGETMIAMRKPLDITMWHTKCMLKDVETEQTGAHVITTREAPLVAAVRAPRVLKNIEALARRRTLRRGLSWRGAGGFDAAPA
jgi:hypothetical protein